MEYHPYRNRQEQLRLQDGYIELLIDYPWEWFVTFTFARYVHPEAAIRHFRKFIDAINKELFGRRWQNKPHGGVMYAVCTERQSNNNPHLHAVILGVGNLRRLTKMDQWQDQSTSTGFARIEDIKNPRSSIAYITKYLTKDGEIDFSENLGDKQKLNLLLKTDQFEF